VIFAFMSIDTFGFAVLAGLAVVCGLALGIVYLLSAMVDLVAAIVLVAVATVRETLAPFTNTFQEGMASVKAGGSAVWAKLRDLVAPRETTGTVAKAKKESLASSSPEPEIGAGTSQTAEQERGKPVNGYDAHA